MNLAQTKEIPVYMHRSSGDCGRLRKNFPAHMRTIINIRKEGIKVIRNVFMTLMAATLLIVSSVSAADAADGESASEGGVILKTLLDGGIITQEQNNGEKSGTGEMENTCRQAYRSYGRSSTKVNRRLSPVRWYYHDWPGHDRQ
jgi:hypothetical protein